MVVCAREKAQNGLCGPATPGDEVLSPARRFGQDKLFALNLGPPQVFARIALKEILACVSR
jgi:hypothetical protein